VADPRGGLVLLRTAQRRTYLHHRRAEVGQPAAGELNRHGQLVTTPPLLAPLDAAQVRRLLGGGAIAVDLRPVGDYAAEHIPGSIAIPLRAQYATWLGWLVAPDVPIVIVRNPDQDPADILWPALNVGYTNVMRL